MRGGFPATSLLIWRLRSSKYFVSRTSRSILGNRWQERVAIVAGVFLLRSPDPDLRRDRSPNVASAVTRSKGSRQNDARNADGSSHQDGFGSENGRNLWVSLAPRIAPTNESNRSPHAPLDDLPAPFDIANGQTMWLAPPDEVSENSGISDPNSAPGYPTFLRSTLRCTPTYLDWSSFGTLYVFHEFIVPGGRYLFQEVDAICAFDGESAFSSALEVSTNPVWADVVSNCETTPCGPPDGIVNVTTDLVALLDKFLNKPGAAAKVRLDIQPETPDGIVGILEVTRTLDAFSGATYPYVPSSVPCN